MLKRWRAVESLDDLGGDGFIAGELSGEAEIPDGLLTVNGVPTSREIEVRDRKSRRVVAVRRSNVDGTYRFPGLNPSLQYDVIARDFAGDYEDVIAGAVRPHTPDLLVPVAASDKMATPFSDPFVVNVVSLLHFGGADGSTTFTDETGRAWAAYENAQIDTAQSMFGGASGLFDGTGDYISTSDSADFYFTGDFTLETFYRPAAIGSRQFLCGQGDFGATNIRSMIEVTTAGLVKFWCSNAVTLQTATSISAGSWCHIAITRNGTAHTIWVDGISRATLTSATIPADYAGVFNIGRCGDYAGFTANGHFDEFRITKGVARYTANFTPPTAPFAL